MNLVVGIHPVETLLREAPAQLKTIYYIPKKRPSARIIRLIEMAQTHHIPIIAASPGEAPPTNIPHQGIWAKVPPFTYTALKKWLLQMENQHTVTLLILDGITDPHNLGAIIRTATCLGCQGIILPKNRSAAITPTVWKASSGAVGSLPIIREVNLVRCVERLKREGFWIFGTRSENGTPLWEAPWSERSAIILGSEGKGIHPLLNSHCDMHLSIPLTGPVSSLNVSVATGMILYERARWLTAQSGEGEHHD